MAFPVPISINHGPTWPTWPALLFVRASCMHCIVCPILSIHNSKTTDEDQSWRFIWVFGRKFQPPPPKETFSTENSYISSLTHTSRGCGMIDATNSILLLPGLAWPGEFPGSLRLTTEVFPFPFSRDICPAGPIMARVLLRLGIKTSHHHHHHSLGCQPACFVH